MASYKDYNSNLQYLRVIAMTGSLRKGYVSRVSETQNKVYLTQDITKARKCRTENEVHGLIDICSRIDPKYVYVYALS